MNDSPIQNPAYSFTLVDSLRLVELKNYLEGAKDFDDVFTRTLKKLIRNYEEDRSREIRQPKNR